jgi:hypothetical protein
MTSNQATVAVIEALESLGIPYMVVGSLSSNYYGVARSTHDADFVVHLESASIGQVMQRIGPGLRLDSQMSFETVTGTSKYVLTLPDDRFKIELFLLSDDLHDQQRFARRRRGVTAGRETFVPTAEDVIIMKLRWSLRVARTKDIDDVRNVLAVQRNALDWEYLHHWCDIHGTRKLLDDLRASLPPG